MNLTCQGELADRESSIKTVLILNRIRSLDMNVNQTNDVIKNRLLRLFLSCKKRNEFFSLFGIFFLFSFFGFLVFFRVVIRRWRLRQLEPIPSRFFWRNCEVLLYFTTATSQFYSILKLQHLSFTLFFNPNISVILYFSPLKLAAG